jgi:hypothetical protein
MFSTLRTQLKTLLDTIATLYEVSTYPRMEFGGYPSASLYAYGLETPTNYVGRKENLRNYIFKIKLYYDTRNTSVQTAVTSLEALVDSIINAIDKQNTLASASRTIGVSLGTGYEFINIRPIKAEWDEKKPANFLVFDINVAVSILVDIS